MIHLICAVLGHDWLLDVSTSDRISDTSTQTFHAHKCARCGLVRP